jgi:ABC-type multidrug transport system fused ATPase/permease subunit
LAFILLLDYVVDPLASFPYMLGDIKVSVTSVNRIRELLEQPIEPSGSESKVEASDIAVKLENVCFNYTASVDVLKILVLILLRIQV